MTIFNKPTLWCLFLHQPVWSLDNATDVTYCPACEYEFYYPTRQADEPVYKT